MIRFCKDCDSCTTPCGDEEGQPPRLEDSDLSDDDLPGMWSSSDFTGGPE